MAAKSQDHSSSTDEFGYVVQLHVGKSTGIVVSAVEKGVRVLYEKVEHLANGQQQMTRSVDANVTRLIDSQNQVADNLNALAEAQAEMKEEGVDQARVWRLRAENNEHISFQTRGRLGAEERKRRKVDLDEIARLRMELGISRRQNRDKDRMVETMSSRLELLANEQAETRIETADRQTMMENALKEMQDERDELFHKIGEVRYKEEQMITEVKEMKHNQQTMMNQQRELLDLIKSRCKQKTIF